LLEFSLQRSDQLIPRGGLIDVAEFLSDAADSSQVFPGSFARRDWASRAPTSGLGISAAMRPHRLASSSSSPWLLARA